MRLCYWPLDIRWPITGRRFHGHRPAVSFCAPCSTRLLLVTLRLEIMRPPDRPLDIRWPITGRRFQGHRPAVSFCAPCSTLVLWSPSRLEIMRPSDRPPCRPVANQGAEFLDNVSRSRFFASCHGVSSFCVPQRASAILTRVFWQRRPARSHGSFHVIKEESRDGRDADVVSVRGGSGNGEPPAKRILIDHDDVSLNMRMTPIAMPGANIKITSRGPFFLFIFTRAAWNGNWNASARIAASVA